MVTETTPEPLYKPKILILFLQILNSFVHFPAYLHKKFHMALSLSLVTVPTCIRLRASTSDAKYWDGCPISSCSFAVFPVYLTCFCNPHNHCTTYCLLQDPVLVRNIFAEPFLARWFANSLPGMS